MGTSEGPRHGAIIQSGVPLEFLRSEQEEEAVWKAQFEVGSQIQDHLEWRRPKRCVVRGVVEVLRPREPIHPGSQAVSRGAP